jgi:diketogulonate reductase-like aldo/keto reductase
MRLFSAALLTWLVTAQEPSPITPLKGTQVNEMPILGLGTWYIRGNASQTIAAAIVEGYRHLDCAYIYFNQEEIAPGIKEGMRKANITRKDLWITSKLWNSQ